MGMPYWICRRRRRGEDLQLAGVAGWNKTVSREKGNWRGRSMLSPETGHDGVEAATVVVLQSRE